MVLLFMPVLLPLLLGDETHEEFGDKVFLRMLCVNATALLQLGLILLLPLEDDGDIDADDEDWSFRRFETNEALLLLLLLLLLGDDTDVDAGIWMSLGIATVAASGWLGLTFTAADRGRPNMPMRQDCGRIILATYTKSKHH